MSSEKPRSSEILISSNFVLLKADWKKKSLEIPRSYHTITHKVDYETII